MLDFFVAVALCALAGAVSVAFLFGMAQLFWYVTDAFNVTAGLTAVATTVGALYGALVYLANLE